MQSRSCHSRRATSGTSAGVDADTLPLGTIGVVAIAPEASGPGSAETGRARLTRIAVTSAPLGRPMRTARNISAPTGVARFFTALSIAPSLSLRLRSRDRVCIVWTPGRKLGKPPTFPDCEDRRVNRELEEERGDEPTDHRGRDSLHDVGAG